ncbi:hypothetical protein FAM09_12560 [Niastella caeni]|uniref:Uncharacterized protein n=1 Tax=Niastella caeni TaxID=2569763 RepID=A0A4V4H166_9BACT|nr:hypothetical protein [Niastella caeni]THU39336.1 hypothetical protein FAM09_12560 [Niastella caeni]
MNKQIETYKELLNEQKQLQVMLHNKKELIKLHVRQLKLQLNPMYEMAGHVKKFTTRDKTSFILAISSDLIANTLLKKIILARAGWFTKIVVPYLFRNYSSNFLKEQKDRFFNRLSDILKRKHGKPG